MPAIHEVISVMPKTTWKGRRNLIAVNPEPARAGESKNISYTQHESPRDNYVVKAVVSPDCRSIQVVTYMMSPDDLDSISRRTVALRNVNKDPELRTSYRVLS